MDSSYTTAPFTKRGLSSQMRKIGEDSTPQTVTKRPLKKLELGCPDHWLHIAYGAFPNLIARGLPLQISSFTSHIPCFLVHDNKKEKIVKRQVVLEKEEETEGKKPPTERAIEENKPEATLQGATEQ